MPPESPPDPDQWWHRPDVWSGLVLAAAFGGRSFQPSLMPRATAHQAIITGTSGALGFGLAQAQYGLFARTGSVPGDVGLLGAAAAGGFAASRILAETDHEPDWRPIVRTVGSAMAAGSTAAMLGVVVRAVPLRRRKLAGAVLTTASLLTGTRAVVTGLKAQKLAHEGEDVPAPRPLPALTQGVGIGAVLGTLVTGFRRTHRIFTSVLQRRLGLPATISTWAGRGLSVAVWFGTGKAVADTAVRGLRVYDRVVDAGFDRAPLTPHRTSGPGSTVPFARLGREGRRFVLNAPMPIEIQRVMGDTGTHAEEPVRVFVGYSAARSDDDRIAIAVEELRRTGAFDKRLLVVCCPAGNGYVNTLPLEVVDHVLRGDTAAVAVQYGRLPSILTLRRVTRGGDVQRKLLQAIGAELAGRPEGRRPTIVLYGESLGAWSGQDTFLHGGIEGFDELGVSRALWTGVPYYSGWRRKVLIDRSIPVPEGSVVEVSSPEPLLAMTESERDKLRAVMLTNSNDPVGYLAAGLFVREPDWLGNDRPPGVPAAMRWLPGITAVQVIVDAMNAMRPTPGRFRSTGHEYNGDLPEATVAAYGLERPDADTWSRLVAHLQAVDAARAAHSHTASPGPAPG